MADPLSLLRRYNINKEKIVERDGHIIFGELSLPKTVKTNFRCFGSGRDGTAKDYYTLECLLYLLNNNQLPHPAYVRQAAGENIPAIKRPDRKVLMLSKDTSKNVDEDVPQEKPSVLLNKYKRTLDDDGNDDESTEMTKNTILKENKKMKSN